MNYRAAWATRATETPRWGAICLAALALALACGGTTPEVPTRPTSQRTPSVPPPGPIASAAPEKPPSGAVVSPFSVVAKVTGIDGMHTLALHRIGGNVLVDVAAVLTEPRDGKLLLDAKYRAGPPVMRGVSGLAGDWPDDAWITMIQSTPDAGQGAVYHWQDGWKSVGKSLPSRWTYLGISEWSKGRKLTLARNYLHGAIVPPAKFKIVSGPPGQVPVLTRGTVSHCASKLLPYAFVSFASGLVLVYGELCSGGAPAIETFRPGSARGKIEVLEGFRDERCSRQPASCAEEAAFFDARSESDIWLVQSKRLAHYDGSSWSFVEAPASKQNVAALSAAGTVVWVVTKNTGLEAEPPGELWRRQGAGEWELVPVPDFADYPRWARGPTDVVALTRDDVWLLASGRVLHTRPGTGPIQEIASDAFAAQ